MPNVNKFFMLQNNQKCFEKGMYSRNVLEAFSSDTLQDIKCQHKEHGNGTHEIYIRGEQNEFVVQLFYELLNALM